MFSLSSYFHISARWELCCFLGTDRGCWLICLLCRSLLCSDAHCSCIWFSKWCARQTCNPLATWLIWSHFLGFIDFERRKYCYHKDWPCSFKDLLHSLLKIFSVSHSFSVSEPNTTLHKTDPYILISIPKPTKRLNLETRWVKLMFNCYIHFSFERWTKITSHAANYLQRVPLNFDWRFPHILEASISPTTRLFLGNLQFLIESLLLQSLYSQTFIKRSASRWRSWGLQETVFNFFGFHMSSTQIAVAQIGELFFWGNLLNKILSWQAMMVSNGWSLADVMWSAGVQRVQGQFVVLTDRNHKLLLPP